MENFQKNIVKVYGQYGQTWLKQLPCIIEEIATKWQLSALKIQDNLCYNYVASGYHRNASIILKISPNISALHNEIMALKALQNSGVIKLLNYQENAILLERAIPGRSLKTMFPAQDNLAIEVICKLITKLHSQHISINHNFPHLKDWLQALDHDINIPRKYLLKARDLRDDLLTSTQQEVLLHGDLHHENILQHNDAWIIIDPKGVIGDPYYEITTFIRNPMPELSMQASLEQILQQRINTFTSRLKLNSQRLKDWCFVQGVLSWIWALEDNLDSEYFNSLVTYFYKLRKNT